MIELVVLSMLCGCPRLRLQPHKPPAIITEYKQAVLDYERKFYACYDAPPQVQCLGGVYAAHLREVAAEQTLEDAIEH